MSEKIDNNEVESVKGTRGETGAKKHEKSLKSFSLTHKTLIALLNKLKTFVQNFSFCLVLID